MSAAPILIAEVKTKSPFGYESDKSWDELFEVANTYGDWISIHTDSRWGGSFELIKKARKLTSKPILAKGFHETDEEIERAIEAGADYVLVVGRIPKIHQEKLLIEPNSIEELLLIPKNVKAVWNARDLENGKQKPETFEQARKIFNGWLCQASFIETKEDVEKGADAILVGQGLEKFIGQS